MSLLTGKACAASHRRAVDRGARAEPHCGAPDPPGVPLPARVFYADEFPLPLPPGHRFPMQKYRLLRERVMDLGVVPGAWLGVPAAATDADLRTVHAPAYVSAIRAGSLGAAAMRRIGFPWSPEMVERSRRSVGGTIAACRAALIHGAGVNLAGGTHHAFAERGEGYCVFNDAAVAVRVLQASGAVRRVLIVDTDVHQGNGTAALFRGDDSVFTLDLHGERNFPFAKEACDLDVPLADGTGDEEYLDRLEAALRSALPRSGPDLAIYVSGADPFEGDRLGRLALTKEGLARRDELVFGALGRAGVPVATTMAGGYAADVTDTVAIHCATVHAALRAPGADGATGATGDEGR